MSRLGLDRSGKDFLSAKILRSARHADVVHITTVHSADDARILYREAAGLQALGVDITVCGPLDSPNTIEGVPIRPIHKPTGFVWRIFTSTWRGFHAAWSSGAGLVHFHDPELLPAALLTKAVLRKHVVYDAHEDISLVMLKDRIPRILRKTLAWLVDRVDGFCVKYLDGVVTPTRLLSDKYLERARRVETFVNYPANAFLRQRDNAWLEYAKRKKQIIHLGTLRISRLQFLIRVAEEFIKKHPDWTMMLAGMHAETLTWFEKNITGNVRKYVFAVGKLPHMDVAKILCESEIGINYHPLDSRQIQVAIPLKVFEYLACGLPTVTTKVPLLLELVKDCPAVLPCEDDVTDYVKKLDKLVCHEEQLEHQSNMARQFSDERFNCKAEAQKLLKFYQTILGKKS